MLDSVRLAEKMDLVAVTGWHDRLYLAWVGYGLTPDSNYRLNLGYSPDGREITGMQQLAQRTYGMYTVEPPPWKIGSRPKPGPSLAVSGEQLYLAWTGGDCRVNILADPQGPQSVHTRLEEAKSYHTPALCSHQGSLILAWTGTDDRINILADPQGPHGAPVRLEEAKSYRGPGLCSHQGSLVLAWTGTDHRINILADPQSPHGAPARLEETFTPWMPALCSHQGSLVLAWMSDEDFIGILTGPGSPRAHAQLEHEARSGREPALCSHQGSLILAWAGTDGHLNLARVSQPGRDRGPHTSATSRGGARPVDGP